MRMQTAAFSEALSSFPLSPAHWERGQGGKGSPRRQELITWIPYETLRGSIEETLANRRGVTVRPGR